MDSIMQNHNTNAQHTKNDSIKPNCEIGERIDITSYISIFRLKPDEGRFPKFKPGQFINLAIGSKRKAYSIASPPGQRKYIELLINRINEGEMTPSLFNLREHDRIWMSGRAGGFFTLESVPPYCNLVMAATGTGIAPYMSMLRDNPDMLRERRVILIQGVRRTEDLAYQAQIRELAEMQGSRLEHLPHISSQDGRYIQDIWPEVIEKKDLTPSNTHIMLCGNPNMIKAMIEVSEQFGFRKHRRKAPGQIHTENYWD